MCGVAMTVPTSRAVRPVISRLSGRGVHVPNDCCCLHKGRLYLEELDLPASASESATQWARRLSPLVSPGGDLFIRRFAVVDDETMTYLWETALQVDARVRLDPNTRTVAQGALWLEESLPPESLLIGLLAADRSRRPGVTMGPEEILGFALGGDQVLQLGGKASTGRGRCRVLPLSRAEVGHAKA
jgi:CRISPR-associated protein Cmr4